MSGLTRDISVTRIALAPVLGSDIQDLIQTLAGGNAAGVADLSGMVHR